MKQHNPLNNITCDCVLYYDVMKNYPSQPFTNASTQGWHIKMAKTVVCNVE